MLVQSVGVDPDEILKHFRIPRHVEPFFGENLRALTHISNRFRTDHLQRYVLHVSFKFMSRGRVIIIYYCNMCNLRRKFGDISNASIIATNAVKTNTLDVSMDTKGVINFSYGTYRVSRNCIAIPVVSIK